MAKIDKHGLTLEANRWVVRWVDLNEGLDGEYDENNPSDVAYLRFDVYRRGDDGYSLEEPNFDSSYCTFMPRSTTVSTLVSALLLVITALLKEDEKPDGEKNYKGLMQRLSWMEPAWFEKFNVYDRFIGDFRKKEVMDGGDQG